MVFFAEKPKIATRNFAIKKMTTKEGKTILAKPVDNNTKNLAHVLAIDFGGVLSIHDRYTTKTNQNLIIHQPKLICLAHSMH
jgi:hypothetical protein